LQIIKTDVDDHNRPVNNTLDIIDELVETGSDVLSPDELSQLQVIKQLTTHKLVTSAIFPFIFIKAKGKKLRERYDFAAFHSDKLYKRMVSAFEELHKFRGELTSFRTWMDKAYKV